MPVLDSTSTLTQVENAYKDNASYAESADVAKGKAFITACRFLLLMRPTETGHGQAHMRLSPELIQKEMSSAQQWVEANDTGADSSNGSPAVRRMSFENFDR